MNNEMSQKAIEDIKYIKEVIQKTSSSMAAFSNIFIGWGLLFLVINIIFYIGSKIPIPFLMDKMNLYDIFMKVLILLALPLIIVITVIMYKKIVKENPLKGVSKQLMNLWIYIIIFNAVCYAGLSFSVNTIDNQITYRVHILGGLSLIPIALFVFAFGLLCINVFTGFKFPAVFALVYAIAGFYFLFSGVTYPLLYLMLTPVTLLVIGLYLKNTGMKVI